MARQKSAKVEDVRHANGGIEAEAAQPLEVTLVQTELG
jgi:hypothetical protein